MPGIIQQMAASQVRAGACPHALDRPGSLVDTPVTGASDEHRGDTDRAAVEHLKLRAADPLCGATVPLHAALQPDPRMLAAINKKFALRQPVARRDGLGPRH